MVYLYFASEIQILSKMYTTLSPEVLGTESQFDELTS